MTYVRTFFNNCRISILHGPDLDSTHAARKGRVVCATELAGVDGPAAVRDEAERGMGGTSVLIHVGGTRRVPSSTDNTMKIRARITLTVEFIRGYILIFLFYVSIQGRV